MMVIGLTGKICAGKNQYAALFEEWGALVVDVDLLGHAVLDEQREQIIARFGAEVATEGKIDRSALASRVFSDSVALKALEAILHPAMVERCRSIIAESIAPVVVLNAALLYRMGLADLCDRILFIKAPLFLRYRRCKLRQGLSWSAFKARNNAQKDIKVSLCKGKSEVQVFHNGGSRTIIHRQVTNYCDTIGTDISALR